MGTPHTHTQLYKEELTQRLSDPSGSDRRDARAKGRVPLNDIDLNYLMAACLKEQGRANRWKLQPRHTDTLIHRYTDTPIHPIHAALPLC